MFGPAVSPLALGSGQPDWKGKQTRRDAKLAVELVVCLRIQETLVATRMCVCVCKCVCKCVCVYVCVCVCCMCVLCVCVMCAHAWIFGRGVSLTTVRVASRKGLNPPVESVYKY